MSATTVLADRFEEHRAHLKAVTYRLLGSQAEADDAAFFAAATAYGLQPGLIRWG